MRIREIVLPALVFFILISVKPFYGESQNSENRKKMGSLTTVSGKPSLSLKATELDQKKLKAEILKLQEEVESLKAEVLKLNGETKKLKSSEQNIKQWLTAGGGGIIASIILVLGGYFHKRLRQKTQKAQMEQDKILARDEHKLAQSKMKQDKELAREQHLLAVFKELGSGDSQIRIGAAAILIQRLTKIKKENESDEERIYDLPMFASALLAQTKQEKEEKIQKYIADGMVKALGAIVPDEEEAPDPEKKSPLKIYNLDFQNAKLYDAWWRRVDAREVDFFGASIVKASLREAFLQKAVFQSANLSNAILCGAKLEGTNFANANLRKADLRNVDFSDSTVDGADFREAKFDEETKFKKDQLKKARFSRNVARMATIVD